MREDQFKELRADLNHVCVALKSVQETLNKIAAGLETKTEYTPAVNVRLSDLDLTVRARKGLVGMDINSIEHLCRCTPGQFLERRNFGVTSLICLREELAKHGLHLRGDEVGTLGPSVDWRKDRTLRLG